MAVALGVASLHVVGKPEADLSEVERASLGVVVDWANEAVSTYLAGSPAPAAIVTAATLRAVYYDWHTRLNRRPPGETLTVRFRRDMPINPLRASGAEVLLSRHKRRGVGAAS